MCARWLNHLHLDNFLSPGLADGAFEEFEEECWVSLAQTIEQHIRKAVESLTFSSFFCPQDLLMALCEEFEEECCVSLAQTTEQHVR
jgi:hypothetical protein